MNESLTYKVSKNQKQNLLCRYLGEKYQQCGFSENSAKNNKIEHKNLFLIQTGICCLLRKRRNIQVYKWRKEKIENEELKKKTMIYHAFCLQLFKFNNYIKN